MVLATGASYRRLDVAALDRLADAGVFYSAGTQGQALTGDPVLVVGGETRPARPQCTSRATGVG